MSEIVFIWIEFFFCAAVITYSGYKLSYYADVLSEKTRITRGLIGFTFLALATSLPEFVTGASAVVLANSPDLAVGDVFGSIIINLAILVLLDFIQGKGPLTYETKPSNILYGGLDITLMGILVFSIFLRSQSETNFGFLGVGFDSVALLVVLFLGMKLILGYKGQEKLSEPSFQQKLYGDVRLGSAIGKFSLFFILIGGFGTWLPLIASKMAILMGWSESFVGTAFLGLTTSLPEIIVGCTALKFATDMAVGNILGSNFFDVLVIPFCDFLYVKGELLAYTSTTHLITLTLGILLTSIVIIGLVCRSRRSFINLGLDAIAVMVTILIGGYFLLSSL